MVVLDAVLIKGPGYRTEDCGANGKDGAGALGRVKKVVSLSSNSNQSSQRQVELRPEVAWENL